MGKRIIVADDILEAARTGKTLLSIAGECIVTPGARDKAAELGVLLEEEPEPRISAPVEPNGKPSTSTEQIVHAVCALMKGRIGPHIPQQELERLVREVVAARLAGSRAPAAQAGPAETRSEGVCLISGARLLEAGSGPIPVDGKVLVANAICSGDTCKLSGGYLEWQKSSFSRTVESDEIGVVVEGELHLAVGGKTLIARSGDMIYFQKGAQVVYTAPAKVRIACVNCL